MLARRRLPEGPAGMARLHALVGGLAGEDEADAEVAVGIETGRGPRAAALVAAGYLAFAVNPLQAARFRDRHGVSGAKSGAGDAHALADMVRADSRQLRPAAGDSPQAGAVKVLARMHKTLIWERTRQVQRLRHQLRDYFPAALEAFGEDLDAPDALELLAKAPDPDRARRLTRAQVAAALRRARRRNIEARTGAVIAALRGEQLGQPAALAAAYAATVRALITVTTALNEQVRELEGQAAEHFRRHPDAEVYLSQPGLGPVLAARVLAELGDDQRRYASAKARRNYAGTSPVTRASGKRKLVAARWVHNSRAYRRAARPGLRRPHRIPRRPRVLRRPPRPRHQSQRRPPPPGQPGSSESSTDASKPAPGTTRKPHGPTAKISRLLDRPSPWDVCSVARR